MFFEGDAAKVATTPTTATGSVGETPTPTHGHADASGRDGTDSAPRPPRPRRPPTGRRSEPYLQDPARASSWRSLAGGGYWKLVLAPKRAQAAELDERVAVAQAAARADAGAVDHLPRRAEGLQGQLRHGRPPRQGRPDRRRHALAARAARRVRQARRRRLRHDQRQRRRRSSADATGATPAAPGAVNAGAFSAMPFSFGFTGTFATLGDFFVAARALRHAQGRPIAVSGRLLRIESLTLAPGEDGWPAWPPRSARAPTSSPRRPRPPLPRHRHHRPRRPRRPPRPPPPRREPTD